MSCIALELIGAASATIPAQRADSPRPSSPPRCPTGVADLTLIAIAVGAVAANVINIYSGAISFMTLGIKLPLKFRRALIAGVFGLAGFFVACVGAARRLRSTRTSC